MPTLNKKQQLFVDEYLIDLNATQAAIRAGYSEKTAQEQSSRLLSNVMVQEAVEQRMKERQIRTEITQDKVLEDIEKVKQDAMAMMEDKDGKLVMRNHAAALKACELQGKHLKMFTEKLDHSVSGVDLKPLPLAAFYGAIGGDDGEANDDKLSFN